MRFRKITFIIDGSVSMIRVKHSTVKQQTDNVTQTRIRASCFEHSLLAAFSCFSLKSSSTFFDSLRLSDFVFRSIFCCCESRTLRGVYGKWISFLFTAFWALQTNVKRTLRRWTNWIMELNELSKQVFRTSCTNNWKQFAGKVCALGPRQFRLVVLCFKMLFQVVRCQQIR